MLIAHLIAFMTVVIWGVTFVSTKILLRTISAEEILFIRFLMGWLALWFFSPKWLPWLGVKDEINFIAAGFFGVTLYFLLENIALEYTYASNVGVIVSAAPFFTALVGWIFFGADKPGPLFYLGFIMAMLGIGLISFSDSNICFNQPGDLLALLAALAWAFYSGFTKKLTALNLGSLITTRRIFFYGILFMLPVLIFSSKQATMQTLIQAENLGNLLFLGLGASALCFVTWTFCIKRLGVASASAWIYLVPVITVLTAAIWLKESLTLRIILGMALVILGLIISEAHLGRKKRLGIHSCRT